MTKAIVKVSGKSNSKVAKKPKKILPVLVNFILDKSGSMADVLDETIRGFNTYVDTLRKDRKSRYLFTLTLFDTQSVDMLYVAVPLNQVKDLDRTSYIPGMMTPLFDAVGNTVALVEKNGQTKNTKRVLTVIMTDGHENSSKEWTKEKVQALVKEKEATGKWTFVFLGASLDAADVGASVGLAPGNVAYYSKRQTVASSAAMASATMCYASAPAKSMRSMASNFYKETKTVLPTDEDEIITGKVTTTGAATKQ
jgi:hypothetical protein